MDDIRDDELDGGLFAAFRPKKGESVLQSIQRLHHVSSSVLLRDPDDDASPVLLQRDENARDDSRFQILGEIARGGIGVVYKGRDKDLNREIALKVLREEHADRPDVVQRFIEEAQVGGQLQHPGIVPIYGLGLQDDGRPSFAMKLIKGKTLAELLDNNPRNIDLIGVFEQVTQTIAYAHSRGVIHRDLKPANIMIGSFGEVQVVDWGFAKVLGHDELARPEHTIIATVRSGEEGSQSIAGSVMGTPAYMPPEQALGHIDQLDESSDVFALGAILCEILTGEPPYMGKQKDQLIAASQCRTGPALELLERAEVADELKCIARDCLQALTGDRPRNASVLAERLAAHFAGVEERARTSELNALNSESRAAGERYRKRRSLAVAAIALVAIVGGSIGYLTWKSDIDARIERARPQVAAALRDARTFEGEQSWDAAVASAKQAMDIARSAGVDDAGAATLLVALERDRKTAAQSARIEAADRQLLADLENARALGADHYGPRKIDDAFRAAVAMHTVDPSRLRDSPDAARFAAAFDWWALLRRTRMRGKAAETRLPRVPDAWARAIDPGHNTLRDAMLDGEALETMLQEQDVRALPVAMIDTLSATLAGLGEIDAALDLARRAQRLHPGDFWIHMRLGRLARESNQNDLALRHYTAALAARPDSIEPRHYIGVVRETLKDLDGALEVWRDAMKLRPDWGHGLYHITSVLARQGKFAEAHRLCEECTKSFPDQADMHMTAGTFYWRTRKLDRAIEHYARAVTLAPEYPNHHQNLGLCLIQKYGPDEALAKYHEVVGDAPIYAAYDTMADAMWRRKKFEDTERLLRMVVDLVPERTEAYGRLGTVLRQQGKYENAIAAKRKAVEVAPEAPEARYDCGTTLYELGRDQGNDEYIEDAVRHLLKTVELDPRHAQAWCNLAFCYRQLGRWSAARDAFKKGHEIGSARSSWSYASAKWLALAEQMVKLEKRLPAVIRGDDHPANKDEAVALATMALFTVRDYPAATRLYRTALEPGVVSSGYDHLNAACAAASAGEHAQAIEWLRELLKWLTPGQVPPRLQNDPRLASIRTDEFKEFWAEVDAHRKVSK